jgi:hypothetical protein
VDDADTKLEGGAQSICYFVWGSGAGMNISYTFNLTPPSPLVRPQFNIIYRYPPLITYRDLLFSL